MATSLDLYAKSMDNVVLRDANGNPSIFVRHPKQMSSDFDASLPEHVHPAFIVNNTTDDALLIAKYKSCELESNGTQYSLPYRAPKHTMNYDTFLTKMRAFGGNVTGMTIADHGLMVLMAHTAGFVSHGNNNYGADYRSGTKYALNAAVVIGDKRIFRGWEYECIKGHTTSATLLPTDAPAYWKKGKHVGGDMVENFVADNNYSGYHTLTGSGPVDWNMLNDPCLEADIQGNLLEQIYGFRLVNCELQILPDNNAANPAADLSASSSAWKAILPHANDTGCDLVAPGTVGTLHYTWQNSKITLDNVAPGSFDGSTKNTAFKDLAVNSTNVPYVPDLVKELGLFPISGTTVDGMMYICLTADERVARRAGHYYNTSGAGVACLNCAGARSISSVGYGARARSRA